jgi:putative peptidoglycan lipid II flippase
MEINNTSNIRNYLLNNFSTITLCRGFSTISSIILDAIILSYYGLNWKTDAYFAAYTIPLLVISTLELQVTNVLVPIITQCEKEKGIKETFAHINNFTTIFILFLLLLSIANAFLAKIFIPLQIPGIESSVINVSINMSLILSWIIPVRGLAIILNSILYTYHDYFFTSSMKMIINICTIVTIIILGNVIDIYALVIGTMIGTILHVVILIFVLAKKGYAYRFSIKLKDQYVFRMFRLIMYPLSGSALSESKVIFENYFASMLGSGTVSILRYSTRLIQSFSSILLSGIYSTVLPLISNLIAQNNYEHMKKSLLNGIKMMIFISLPLSIWLVYCGKPLLILLFERGEFTRADANIIGVLIAIMVPYIICSRIISIFQSPFFASIEMKIPIYSMLISLVGHVMSMYVLKDIIGIYGFALSYSISTILSALYIGIMFNKKFGALGWKSINLFMVKMVAIVGIMMVGFIITNSLISNFNTKTFYEKIIMLTVPTTVGAIIFISLSFIMRLIDGSIIREILAK